VEYLLRASEMLHALVRSHPRPASQTNALAPVQRTFWEQIAMVGTRAVRVVDGSWFWCMPDAAAL